jgi:hypothetical protein
MNIHIYVLQESGGNRSLLQFPSRSDTLPVTVQYDSDSSSDDSSTTSSHEHSKGDRKHYHKHHNTTSKLQTTLLRPLSGFGDAWRLMTIGTSSNSNSNQHAPHDSSKADDTNGETPTDVDDHADTTITTTADATGSIDNSSRAVLQTSKTCVIS